MVRKLKIITFFGTKEGGALQLSISFSSLNYEMVVEVKSSVVGILQVKLDFDTGFFQIPKAFDV